MGSGDAGGVLVSPAPTSMGGLTTAVGRLLEPELIAFSSHGGHHLFINRIPPRLPKEDVEKIILAQLRLHPFVLQVSKCSVIPQNSLKNKGYGFITLDGSPSPSDLDAIAKSLNNKLQVGCRTLGVRVCTDCHSACYGDDDGCASSSSRSSTPPNEPATFDLPDAQSSQAAITTVDEQLSVDCLEPTAAAAPGEGDALGAAPDQAITPPGVMKNVVTLQQDILQTAVAVLAQQHLVAMPSAVTTADQQRRRKAMKPGQDRRLQVEHSRHQTHQHYHNLYSSQSRQQKLHQGPGMQEGPKWRAGRGLPTGPHGLAHAAVRPRRTTADASPSIAAPGDLQALNAQPQAWERDIDAGGLSSEGPPATLLPLHQTTTLPTQLLALSRVQHRARYQSPWRDLGRLRHPDLGQPPSSGTAQLPPTAAPSVSAPPVGLCNTGGDAPAAPASTRPTASYIWSPAAESAAAARGTAATVSADAVTVFRTTPATVAPAVLAPHSRGGGRGQFAVPQSVSAQAQMPAVAPPGRQPQPWAASHASGCGPMGQAHLQSASAPTSSSWYLHQYHRQHQNRQSCMHHPPPPQQQQAQQGPHAQTAPYAFAMTCSGVDGDGHCVDGLRTSSCGTSAGVVPLGSHGCNTTRLQRPLQGQGPEQAVVQGAPPGHPPGIPRPAWVEGTQSVASGDSGSGLDVHGSYPGGPALAGISQPPVEKNDYPQPPQLQQQHQLQFHLQPPLLPQPLSQQPRPALHIVSCVPASGTQSQQPQQALANPTYEFMQEPHRQHQMDLHFPSPSPPPQQQPSVASRFPEQQPSVASRFPEQQPPPRQQQREMSVPLPLPQEQAQQSLLQQRPFLQLPLCSQPPQPMPPPQQPQSQPQPASFAQSLEGGALLSPQGCQPSLPSTPAQPLLSLHPSVDESCLGLGSHRFQLRGAAHQPLMASAPSGFAGWRGCGFDLDFDVHRGPKVGVPELQLPAAGQVGSLGAAAASVAAALSVRSTELLLGRGSSDGFQDPDQGGSADSADLDPLDLEPMILQLLENEDDDGGGSGGSGSGRSSGMPAAAAATPFDSRDTKPDGEWQHANGHRGQQQQQQRQHQYQHRHHYDRQSNAQQRQRQPGGLVVRRHSAQAWYSRDRLPAPPQMISEACCQERQLFLRQVQALSGLPMRVVARAQPLLGHRGSQDVEARVREGPQNLVLPAPTKAAVLLAAAVLPEPEVLALACTGLEAVLGPLVLEQSGTGLRPVAAERRPVRVLAVLVAVVEWGLEVLVATVAAAEPRTETWSTLDMEAGCWARGRLRERSLFPKGSFALDRISVRRWHHKEGREGMRFVVGQKWGALGAQPQALVLHAFTGHKMKSRFSVLSI
ncbi:hypothetical protein VOLCADRAFT_98921 [Volvox carteri f. nagariensis]|uniref:RRM domain-containing protein n=1 Tax=Volvox carteri f. nagariensis TaxID=3068 RepID=D8UGL9_VOLCA|nr:uncharacterized protein VOLCADRAFT_98921 [Volvox carteri f. nagariensis]EFJ41145.1 hypothetical protein VOLCADRAFT_98921 [Volvox carteri f. nagariensis]|eukprot:XP_002957817.1 hypothetical protein VOLCADRAFT_98921 [Volvox carteri f. nagariensis]